MSNSRPIIAAAFLALAGCQSGGTGADGTQGPAGADGQLRIYGDGSAGDWTVSSNMTLDESHFNLQFADFTVAAGATLTIPSGAVIRCQGTFTNNGTIVVQQGAAGGYYRIRSSGANSAAYAPAHPGVSAAAAAMGDVNDTGVTGYAIGGRGGIGLQGFSARQLLRPGPYGGGGGAPGPQTTGGGGGGALVILAQGGIANAGTLRANGGDAQAWSAGGGGGGWIVLASPVSVANTGTIEAKGGHGYSYATSSCNGAGGGGGGGLVHMVAPSATLGTVDVSGGTAQPVSSPSGGCSPVTGGGGGGASYGAGGNGGSVDSGHANDDAEAGGTGMAFASTMSPTALF